MLEEDLAAEKGAGGGNISRLMMAPLPKFMHHPDDLERDRLRKTPRRNGVLGFKPGIITGLTTASRTHQFHSARSCIETVFSGVEARNRP